MPDQAKTPRVFRTAMGRRIRLCITTIMPKRFSRKLLALLLLDVPSCCDFTRVLRVQMDIDERKLRIYFEDICVIIDIHLNHIFCFRTSFHHGNGRDIASASLSRTCMRNLPNAYEALMLVAYLLSYESRRECYITSHVLLFNYSCKLSYRISEAPLDCMYDTKCGATSLVRH